MRFVSLSLLFCFLSLVLFQSSANAEDNKWVEVKVGYANIYKQLDPKSEIIKQAKKGERLEMVYDGTSWYQVKVGKSIGWIERRSGDIVNSPNQFPVITLLLILLVIGGATGVVVYKNKNKPQIHEV